jgi:putative transposase
MAATSKVSVLFHMRKEDLEKQMNDTDDKRSYEHLLAIKLAYDGKTQKEIASALSRSLTTIYHWLNDWNENGLYGIFPNFGGGRPPHLNTKEMDELYKVITKQKPCDLMDTDHVFWDVELVRKYANTKYDVNYTYSGMWKIVRQKFELNYITPFSKDYRKPDDAVEILKKDLRTSLKSSTKKKLL